SCNQLHLHQFKIIKFPVKVKGFRLNAAAYKAETLMEGASGDIGGCHLQCGESDSRECACERDAMLHKQTADRTGAESGQDVQAPEEYLVRVFRIQFPAQCGDAGAIVARETTKGEDALRYVTLHTMLKIGKVA